MLIDRYGRRIDYLRVSITDLCNLDCIYCWDGRRVKRKERSNILRYEEILRIVSVASGLGISKVRISGGEPLVRNGLVGFLRRLSGIDIQILMTTNGILLREYAKELFDAGVSRLNISLDSLREERYKYITKMGSLRDVLSGIDEAVRVGFKVRINMVPLAGINDDEVEDLLRFGLRYGVDIAFIEVMPFIENWKRLFVPNTKIKDKLNEAFDLVKTSPQHTGPATYYKINGKERLVGFISPMSRRFCEGCNRVRLTPDGRLRPCLGDEVELDLMGPIRGGVDDERLTLLIHKAINLKPKTHKMGAKLNSGRGMRSIGG